MHLGQYSLTMASPGISDKPECEEGGKVQKLGCSEVTKNSDVIASGMNTTNMISSTNLPYK